MINIQIQKKIETYWFCITVLILLLITVLSLIPGKGKVSDSQIDKIEHFLAYAGLMFLFAFQRPKYLWLFFITFVFWSGLIEFIQSYIGRTGDWFDLLANSILSRDVFNTLYISIFFILIYYTDISISASVQ